MEDACIWLQEQYFVLLLHGMLCHVAWSRRFFEIVVSDDARVVRGHRSIVLILVALVGVRQGLSWAALQLEASGSRPAVSEASLCVMNFSMVSRAFGYSAGGYCFVLHCRERY